MLEKFRQAKQAEILALMELEAEGRLPQVVDVERPSFSGALSGPDCAVIAEYKRASPSKGAINLHVTAHEASEMFRRAGAAAISVLTEEVYFNGRMEYLFEAKSARLPILRKDFLFHPLQVRVTAATPASALLLIARMFDDPEELGQLLDLAYSYGMEAVVEVFGSEDLERAREAGAEIIQVNNRDLDTLETDLSNSLKLVSRKRPVEQWISASGVESPNDVAVMKKAGFDAVLVGTSIMRSVDPEAMLAGLVRGGRQ